jgi:hypothetical protein
MAKILFFVYGLAFASVAYGQVNLGSAVSFAVLGNLAVSNAGMTFIHGDIGVAAGAMAAITGFPPGTTDGTLHASDGVTTLAHSDASIAYTQASTPTTSTDLTGIDLGGQVLLAGTYHFDTSAMLTGTLILDGKGIATTQWVFQIGSTLVTAQNAVILLINGAEPCNIFWQVGSSATLGGGTSFSGNILALESISLLGNVVYNGGLYALNAAIALIDDVISQGDCEITDASTTTTVSTTTATASTIISTSTVTSDMVGTTTSVTTITATILTSISASTSISTITSTSTLTIDSAFSAISTTTITTIEMEISTEIGQTITTASDLSTVTMTVGILTVINTELFTVTATVGLITSTITVVSSPSGSTDSVDGSCGTTTTVTILTSPVNTLPSTGSCQASISVTTVTSFLGSNSPNTTIPYSSPVVLTALRSLTITVFLTETQLAPNNPCQGGFPSIGSTGLVNSLGQTAPSILKQSLESTPSTLVLGTSSAGRSAEIKSALTTDTEQPLPTGGIILSSMRGTSSTPTYLAFGASISSSEATLPAPSASSSTPTFADVSGSVAISSILLSAIPSSSEGAQSGDNTGSTTVSPQFCTCPATNIPLLPTRAPLSSAPSQLSRSFLNSRLFMYLCACFQLLVLL